MCVCVYFDNGIGVGDDCQPHILPDSTRNAYSSYKGILSPLD